MSKRERERCPAKGRKRERERSSSGSERSSGARGSALDFLLSTGRQNERAIMALSAVELNE